MKRNKDGLTEAEFLKQYQPGEYERPSVTVDMLIFTLKNDKLNLLLIKRREHPFMDSWAIPGGFVGIDESLDDAAKRELKEETGLENIYLEQLYTMGNPNRDPRMRVISSAYLALVSNDNLNPVAGDDASDVAWFSVETMEAVETQAEKTYHLILKNEKLGLTIAYFVKKEYKSNGAIKTESLNVQELPSCEAKLAFDHAEEIVRALDRLRNKVEYIPVAFNLVGKEFTLPELQRVYEIILGKKLYKANFRKNIQPHIMETNKKKHVDGVVRDAKIYIYKEDNHV